MRLSAKKPPAINEITEKILGIKINNIKILESKFMPSPPNETGLLINFGK